MPLKKLNLFFSLVIGLLLVFSGVSRGQTTDFSPKTINTGSILTITGSGFGATRGTSYVSFPRELTFDQSSVLPLSGDYLMWTDTQIQVRVPARAATGSPMIAVAGVRFFILSTLTVANAIQISSFSPTSIAAGTQSLLTINGTGFGTAQGSVHTRASSENSTNSWVGAASVVSWTDTRIVVRVNESAGSGQIAVLINGNWVFSSGSLNVKYAVFGSPSSVPLILANTNGIGGYTFRMENNFAANADANATFTRAFNAWKSATGINWQMGSNTSVNVEATDNVNVIRFGPPADIIVGTLAYTAIHFRACTSGELELVDIDITFDSSLNWNFSSGPPAPNQYDFETVALHQLGHAHGLVHVNNMGDPMYHTTAPGTMRRSLTPEAIEGGTYMLTNSAAASARSCTGVITTPAPTITAFAPTTATNGDIVTLTGTNFVGAAEVYFGSVRATSVTVVSPTVITAVVASGATGNITVFTSGGSAILSGFTYQSKLAQNLSTNPLPTKIFGERDFDPGVISSSGLPITYSSSNLNVATIINNMIHIVSAGATTITAAQAGNTIYHPATIDLSFVVSKAPQYISFTSIPAKLTTDADFTLDATADSGLPVTYLNTNPAVATISNGIVHILAAGRTTITAIQNGDGNYNAAPSIAYELKVSNLPQILLFPEITNKKVNEADFEPGASVNSGLPITYTSSNLDVATIVNNKIHIVGAGTSIITATQAGNLIYASASKQVVLTVSKLTQTLNFPSLNAKDVTAADFDPGATVSSGLPISYTSSNVDVATIVAGKIHIVGAGTTTITASQTGDATYAAVVNATVNLTINKLVQSINLPQIATKTFNDADFDLNATVSSGLTLTYSSSNTDVATIVNNKVHIVGAGTASITASQAGNATYDATSGSVNLTVNKLQQTITFPQIALKNHTDADFDLNAIASSGLAVTYASSNTAVATIVSGKVHIVAGGAAVITASQVGNANINAAPEVTQNLDVVFNIPVSNFTVKSTDETCKTSNNGSINITATQILSYTAMVTVNGIPKAYPFNSVLAVNNLDAGTYNVCVTVAEQPSYKQCFDVVVREPKDLAVYSSIKDNGNSVFLKLEGGERYVIELNGELITTTDQEITLPLVKGNNIVKIASNKTCQGVITKTFLTSNSVSLYPNPVKNRLNIATGGGEKNPVKVEIHALDGRLMHSSMHLSEYGQVGVDVSKLNKGLYVLTLSIGNSKTVHKVVKD
ncbi:T9SS type A sorting domain-containing protein [Pedobacter sp. Du54]|uniref:T9SS type A sorting domain-containing protein n=1 Tax=Pedobacter anseongensis TaxID=3133439 RepID=UPI0030B670EC